jgi:phosphatidylglycerophosphate synthase
MRTIFLLGLIFNHTFFYNGTTNNLDCPFFDLFEVRHMEPPQRSIFSSIANWFTFLRLILTPVLWILAFLGEYTLVGYGLLVVILTDVLDGQFARLLDQITEFGARLDSLADHIIMISAVIWLVMARLDLVTDKREIFLPVVVLYVIAILVGFFKGNRFGGAHLLEGKIFGVFGYLFLILSLLGYDYDFVFYAAMLSWVIHSLANMLYFFKPGLFEPTFRSLILGLMGIKIKSKFINFLLDGSGQD